MTDKSRVHTAHQNSNSLNLDRLQGDLKNKACDYVLENAVGL